MTTRTKVLLTGVAVFLIAIAAFMLIGTNSGNAPGSAQSERANSDPQAPVARTGLADSSDKVRLNLAEGGKALIGETGEIVLTLDIEPGWHVNANPASMEFLIPTVAKSSAGRSTRAAGSVTLCWVTPPWRCTTTVRASGCCQMKNRPPR